MYNLHLTACVQCVIHRNQINSGIVRNDSLQAVAGKSSRVYRMTLF